MDNQEMRDKVLSAMRAVEWNTINAIAARIGESQASVRTAMRQLYRTGKIEQKDRIAEYRIKR